MVSLLLHSHQAALLQRCFDMVKQIDRDVVALGDPGDPEFEASIFFGKIVG